MHILIKIQIHLKKHNIIFLLWRFERKNTKDALL